MEDSEFQKLLQICEPVVNHIKENYGPHNKIVISFESIEVISTEIGVPVTDKNH